jgi:DNA polymerase-1
MIYLISNQKRILSDYIQESTVEECLKYFKDKNIIGLDTETEGFDPFTKKLICIQLGDKDNQFVIDTSVVSVSNLQELLEDSSKTFVGHNLKFDLRFLLKERIVVKNTYDTYVSEQIL